MKAKCCNRVVFCSKTTVYTFLLGGVFIVLGSSRILLMKYSANEDNKYDYLPTTVNICSEVVKLVLCLVLALWVKKKEGCLDHPFECLSWKNFCNSMKWSIPAFLYFLDNLIVFYVLSYLQPAMAVLFSNFVIITTALLFRIVLKPSLEFFLEAPVVLLSIFIYNASKPRSLEYATLRERGKLIKGDTWERSSGDGEEFERLNKPSSDIDTDEDSL
ncbi:UDP-sugar transporter protein SLC35A5 isoform X3 [Lathamus discolor]|uniref:UDP-sugar transporter protein SLC35A5 isoform X3 n=1 Tax=Lathamus discolor TaxID=678569 RepID=UPI0032B79F97